MDNNSAEISLSQSKELQDLLPSETVQRQKPKPPLVPPKPSKSRQNISIHSPNVTETSGVTINSNRFMAPESNQNQSPKTDDNPLGDGDNLPVSIPNSVEISSSPVDLPHPQPLAKEDPVLEVELEQKTDRDHKITRPSDEFGDWSKKAVELESKSDPIDDTDLEHSELDREASLVPQGHDGDGGVGVEELGNLESVNLEEIDVINQGRCPSQKVPAPIVCCFAQLHKHDLEFLMSQIEDIVKDKTILLRPDDSKVEFGVNYLVDNLKCKGMWGYLFVEKLNRIIVRADPNVIEACFKEDKYQLMHKLIDLYRNETRCSVIFRLWCTFYNLVSRKGRSLIPLIELANSGLIPLLKRDFSLAAANKYRCGSRDLETLEDLENQTPKCCPAGEVDLEHKTMCKFTQMEIASILLVPLVTAQAMSKPKLSFDFNAELKFATEVLKVICDLYSHSVHDRDAEDAKFNKTILVHLLITLNLLFPRKFTQNPLVQALVSLNCSISQFRTIMLTIFSQELHMLKGGYIRGVKSLINCPLGVQMTGVNGPMKLFMDILSTDDHTIFDLDDLNFMSNVSQSIQNELGQYGSCDHRVQEIRRNTRDLKNLIHYKVCLFAPLLLERVELSDIRSNPLETSNWEEVPDVLPPTVTSAPRRLQKHFIKTAWHIPFDFVLRILGCSKRTSSVVPVEFDVEYLK